MLSFVTGTPLLAIRSISKRFISSCFWMLHNHQCQSKERNMQLSTRVLTEASKLDGEGQIGLPVLAVA